jgi:predicted DNA repair protein MutK
LPVVWAVAKGSLLNKVILVPAALVISAIAPWMITPLLMLGGLFLCFEGAEKLLQSYFQSNDDKEAHHAQLTQAVADEEINLLEFEKDKIKGAIRTDFILSAEIIVITLGTAAAASFGQQVAVMVGISLIMTVGVYGLVGAIVKIDDAGLYLIKQDNKALNAVGQGLLAFAPLLMKTLSVLGTAAMFLVGGGILLHGLPAIGHAVEDWFLGMGWLTDLLSNLAGGVVGLVAGAAAAGAWQLMGRLKK